MQVYLVGGAVRDKLLGLPIKEKDWVVVGATPEEMIGLGYQPVGKDFPVFLHPKTHEEYALARTERKVAKGYKGFTFHANPDVTLIDDLKRRDLTINAIAESADGELIDPYHGQQDLRDKLLRHVSPAFQEDPVRILRLARFCAKLPDFKVHPDTQHLMKQMVHNGEVDALVAERVWQELARALINPQPIRFFSTLAECDALTALFPAINPQSHGMKALERATHISSSGTVRFAALLHDIESEAIQQLVRRYRIPNDYADLALLVTRCGHTYETIASADAKTLLAFVVSADALRRPTRFNDFLTACHACFSNTCDRDLEKIQKTITAIKSVNIKPLQEKDLKGAEFAKALEQLRIQAIEIALKY